MQSCSSAASDQVRGTNFMRTERKSSMKKIFNSRALALILVLAMAVSLFTISASAATTESLSGHGSNISTITATGVNYETVEYATSTGTRGTIYDYYLAVPAETANGTELTVVFTPAADVSSNFVISKFGSNVPNPPQGINYIYSGASNTYTATMTDGAALVTAYVHNDVRGSFGTFDTYAFHFYTSKPVSISTGDTLTFAGITAIADSDTTSDYAFGYADVTPNGSPDQYGDAVNPYTPYTSDKTGGDGFDLEWAVDISTGLPVDVTGKTFHYVRVYSAVLDFGRFGETSAEITGIFTTYNKATADVGYTDEPTSLTINGTEIANLVNAQRVTVNEDDYGVVFYDASQMGLSEATISASAASTANVYINSSSVGTYTKTSSVNYVRVIVQDGVAAPYIAVIKF